MDLESAVLLGQIAGLTIDHLTVQLIVLGLARLAVVRQGMTQGQFAVAVALGFALNFVAAALIPGTVMDAGPRFLVGLAVAVVLFLTKAAIPPKKPRQD